MLQARQLKACSCRGQHQHHVQHSSTVLRRSSAAFHRLAQPHAAAAVQPALNSQGTSSACGTAAGGVSSSKRSTIAARMVCRDAPRPMWAAKQAQSETPNVSGGMMERMITSEIARCDTLVGLSDIYSQWNNSFNYIHASAALVKCGKLPGGGRSSLVDKMCSTWLTQLPLSDLQGCSNVLWACVRLESGAVQRLWGPTWEAYIQLLKRESTAEGVVKPQQVASPLWACAKLRKLPSVDDLQLMVQTSLKPEMLADAKPQALSNIVWALGELCQLPGWQGGVNEQDVQQLLGKQQLLLVCDSGRVSSNVVYGLARMAGGKAPVINVEFARDCSKQLLALCCGRLGSWNSQDITNTMWACGELGLADTAFVAAAVAAAPRWLPCSMHVDLNQVLAACVALQYRDEAFVQACLHQGLQLLAQQQPSRQGRSSRRPLAAPARDQLAAVCCISVARLDMRSTANTAVDLVSRSGVPQRPSTNPINLAKLWVFHSWLVQHQLLDGKGLTGVLTQQQLQRGAKDAATMGLS